MGNRGNPDFRQTWEAYHGIVPDVDYPSFYHREARGLAYKVSELGRGGDPWQNCSDLENRPSSGEVVENQAERIGIEASVRNLGGQIVLEGPAQSWGAFRCPWGVVASPGA